jgi:hypothetical protein
LTTDPDGVLVVVEEFAGSTAALATKTAGSILTEDYIIFF